MLKICFTFLIISLSALIAFAQTPQPTTTPPPLEDDGDVVKISTNLIQVDVTVTDKNGNPVTNLKADDFEIYENGKKQKITSALFVSSQVIPEGKSTKNKERFGIEIPKPVGEVTSNEVRRTIALVVDDLSLSFESVHFVKRSLRNFVEKQMQQGDLVAIVRTGSGIGALQQFTTDKRRLYAAIEKVKWNSRGAGGISVFKPFSSHKAFDIEIGRGASEGNEDVPVSETGFEDTRKELFASGSLGAIQYVVEGMDRLPGRKSVLLFSDGFQIFSRGETNFTGSSRVLDSLTNLVESANRAAVVIYTMDARGLQTIDFTAADDVGSTPPDEGGIVQTTSNTLISGRRAAFATSRDGINYLAKETGGFSIYNTNDLNAGVKRVLDDQSYYLIAYEPEAESFDPEKRKFNKLNVKVLKNDVEVRYRSGFFNISDDKFKKSEVSLTGNEKILDALVSPFTVNNVSISLSTIFKSDERDNLFVDSYLHINSNDLKFIKTADGKNKAVFDIVVANFGDNGIPTDQISKTFTISVEGQTYDAIIRDGFVYYFTLPVKKPGAYQMRVAIRDQTTDKVGSASQFIEIPKLKKDRLTLSGIVVDNISYKEWNAGLNSDQGKMIVGEDTPENNSSALSDTALRQFKRETVLRYALEVYNTQISSQKRSDLYIRTRLFRDNILVYEGTDVPIISDSAESSPIKPTSGAINLGTNLKPGDYILQIIVTDKLAKEKRQIATQFVQFEIIE